MTERMQLRMDTKTAARILPADVRAERVSYGIAVVTLPSNDLRLRQIIASIDDLKREGVKHFAAAFIQRRYSERELESADLIKVDIPSVVEPSGEECGTIVDSSAACPVCGCGARQVGPLRLDLRKVRRTQGMTRTLAGEVIVSEEVARALEPFADGCAEFGEIVHSPYALDDPVDLKRSEKGKALLARARREGVDPDSFAFQSWLNEPAQRAAFDEIVADAQAHMPRALRNPPKIRQMFVTCRPVELAAETRCVDNPIASTNSYTCPMGHVLGLNIMSEAYVKRASWDGKAICRTRQSIGWRMGTLRPNPLLLVTPAVYRALKQMTRRVRFEVARLV